MTVTEMNKINRALLHCANAAIASLRRLARRREGNVAMIVGLFAIPLVIAGGMATDVGRAYLVKVRLGAALDAAALAVGSETNQTAAQMSTDLQNYFTANYPSTALGNNVTVTPVPSNADLSATTVNYQAQATVPMLFMPLIGINDITVSVTAQTKKTTGLEVAIVLDNTGSMLCGPNDGAPNYSNATCGNGVVASDTTCTNANNTSRICTLINAATQFVNTLTSAINSAQQLYIAVVPYVTTVNVGSALCSGATTCTNIKTDAPSGDFADLRGNIMPVIPIIGTTTSGSTTISSVSMGTPNGTVSGTAAIQAGMYIYGHGIPTGATVSSVSSSSIVISSAASLTFTGNSLAVGPLPNSVCSTCSNTTSPGYTDPTTYQATATLSKTSTTVNLATGTTTNNIVAGMAVSGTGIASGTTVATVVSASQITLSADPSANETTAVTLTFSLAGNTTSSSTTVSNLKGSTTSLNSIVVGMTVTGTGIPSNTYIASTTGSPPTSLTLSAAATSTNSGDALTFTNLGATTTTGSTSVTGVYFNALPSVGNVIVGNGIPVNTTITAVTGTSAQFAAGTGQLTISNAAATPSNFSSATGTCCNTALAEFTPLTYDSTYNSASPAGSSTSQNWGGCVTEATSSDENSSGTGVLNASVSDPDYTEPSGGWPSWYPYWWPNDSTNSWGSNSVQAQDTATETQGDVVSDWLQLYGPNQGCPAPMLALTDGTTSAGQTQILNTISSMWPRDAGGTQVHIGMIWGWRVLSPNGPFAANNGHPLSYSTASSTSWKKVVVLMTDGTEEWPSTDNMTGLGQIADGKIDTTSSTSTAETNLGTRLANVCSNMAASGNFVIYTIGLGSDGASNTDLQNCPGNTGGFFEAATTSNLQTVFNDIAQSLIALRLSQ
jgi:Flp pilus assembly protein TadG